MRVGYCARSRPAACSLSFPSTPFHHLTLPRFLCCPPSRSSLPSSFPCLQDKDLAYWKVDFNEIAQRAKHHGMRLIRTPAVDFSPHSLRNTLPAGGWAPRGGAGVGQQGSDSAGGLSSATSV
jgi:hypothetical protein